MGQLLVRNVDEKLKLNIGRAAERNGRSVQAEVLDTLKREYGNGGPDLVTILGQIREDLGGEALELPNREPARDVAGLG